MLYRQPLLISIGRKLKPIEIEKDEIEFDGDLSILRFCVLQSLSLCRLWYLDLIP